MTTKYVNTIRDILKAKRDELKISRADMAAKLGIKNAYLASIESNPGTVLGAKFIAALKEHYQFEISEADVKARNEEAKAIAQAYRKRKARQAKEAKKVAAQITAIPSQPTVVNFNTPEMAKAIQEVMNQHNIPMLPKVTQIDAKAAKKAKILELLAELLSA